MPSKFSQLVQNCRKAIQGNVGVSGRNLFDSQAHLLDSQAPKMQRLLSHAIKVKLGLH